MAGLRRRLQVNWSQGKSQIWHVSLLLLRLHELISLHRNAICINTQPQRQRSVLIVYIQTCTGFVLCFLMLSCSRFVCVVLTNEINRNANVSCNPVKPLAENSIVHLWHFPTGRKTWNKTLILLKALYKHVSFTHSQVLSDLTSLERKPTGLLEMSWRRFSSHLRSIFSSKVSQWFHPESPLIISHVGTWSLAGQQHQLRLKYPGLSTHWRFNHRL